MANIIAIIDVIAIIVNIAVIDETGRQPRLDLSVGKCQMANVSDPICPDSAIDIGDPI